MAKPEAIKVEQEPLYALLVEGIGQQIRSGALPQGLVLRSNTIARRLQLSRAPVQAALEILHEQGSIKPNGRSFEVVRTNGNRRATPQLENPQFVPPGIKHRIQQSGALWLQIFAKIAAEIGAVVPFGAFRVSELQLAESYGVSRTVIRNALSRLEEWGLVRRDPRGGCTCGPLTEDRIKEIYEARKLIEPFALERVAANLDPVWIAACLDRLESVAASYPDVTPEELEELETDMHVRTFEGFDNSILRRTLESTRLITISTTQLFQRTLGLPAEDPFIDEHHLVFTQLKSGAHELAAAALRHHLDRARATTLDRFGELPVGGPLEIPTYLTPISGDS
jgi:DNA-binding GntR family transcriptional regulator